MGKAFSKVQKKLKDTGGKLSGTLAKVPLSETAYKMALPVITLRYNGLFDFDGWYASMVDWSKNYGYLFLESIYKHKVPSPAGAEQEYVWDLSKNVTDFVKYEIKIVGHIWDMLEVNVDVGGKQRALTNARFEIQLKGTIILDWQKRFKDGGDLGKLFSKLYWNIMSKEIENVYVDQLYYRIWNLHSIMKKYFDMQSKAYPYEKYLGED